MQIPPPTLTDFVEATTPYQLDDWQQTLCARLERLKEEKGQRLLIHAPPQHGKSIIVSQRFPAWYLGIYPNHRVKLACYNISHATGFSRIVQGVMESEEYKALFPHISLRQPTKQEEWNTVQRFEDGQPSFKALGLTTGFVGQGADLLIVDDPYGSPQDAFSELINKSIQLFHDQGVKVRLHEDANMVVMFHRYQEYDYAGYLIENEGLKENGGKWELLRFAAIADRDTVWPDPMQRTEGEKLSPRYSFSYYEEQERAPGWLGQFQGRPSALGGSFFNIEKLEIVDAAPANLRKCRAWDLAASSKSGDRTAGVKIGATADNLFYVTDCVYGQHDPDSVRRLMAQTAALDGRGVKIHVPQDPGQAGKDQAQQLTRMLAGYPVKAEPVSGDKQTRAFGLAAQINAGNVKLVRGNWNKVFIEELRQFPNGRFDDIVDASADSFNEIVLKAERQPVQSLNYLQQGHRREEY